MNVDDVDKQTLTYKVRRNKQDDPQVPLHKVNVIRTQKDRVCRKHAKKLPSSLKIHHIQYTA